MCLKTIFSCYCCYLLTVNRDVFNFFCLSSIAEGKVVWIALKIHQFNASIFNYII